MPKMTIHAMCNKTIIGRTSQAKSSYSCPEKKGKKHTKVINTRLRNWIKSTHSILFSAIPEISLGAAKYKMGHVTLTTPLLRVICHSFAGT